MDWSPPPKLWTPPRPAIVRAASLKDLAPFGASFLPGMMGPMISAAGGAPPTTSYANTGGTGDRTATITITTNTVVATGTIDNFIDGSMTDSGAGSVDWGGGNTINVGDYLFRVDFNGFTGGKQYIDEFKFYSGGTFNYGAFEFQGGNDASSWTTLWANTFSGAIGANTFVLTTPPPNAGYRYYQLIKVTATSTYAFIWHREVEFKIANGT